MLINIVYPSGLTSPRGSLFNFDWITLVVVILLLLIGGIYFVLARPDRHLAGPAGTVGPPEPAAKAVVDDA
jgi:hypothetical protein